MILRGFLLLLPTLHDGVAVEKWPLTAPRASTADVRLDGVRRVVWPSRLLCADGCGGLDGIGGSRLSAPLPSMTFTRAAVDARVCVMRCAWRVRTPTNERTESWTTVDALRSLPLGVHT